MIAVIIPFYSESFVVSETKLLEVQSFCDREGAKPPAIKKTVLTFLVKQSEMKLSGMSFFGNT